MSRFNSSYNKELSDKIGDLSLDVDKMSYSSAATSANTKKLLSKLKRGVSDVSILVIGDSTGNASNEWVYLTAQNLAKMFPAYTVQISTWNATTGTEYSPASIIQTGTGSYTLKIWNNSVSGEVPGYVQGFRWATAIVPTSPDLIFISHGHNIGDPSSVAFQEQTGRNLYLSLTEELTQQFPNAGIVLIAQNPSFMNGREIWQAVKANIIESVAGMRSYGFIDIHQAFLDTGRPNDYILDGTHPNDEGSKLWANVVTSALTNTNLSSATKLNESTLITFGKNYLSNSDFSLWDSANPNNWTPNSYVTASKDTTLFETGSYGCKLSATSTSGTAQLEQGVNLANAGITHLKGKVVTLAVRVFVPASNTATVRIQLVDNTGSANARGMDVASATRDRFVWLFASKRLDENATSIYARLIPRTTGTATVDATFDRAYLVQGINPTVGLA
jgi:GDSL-like Lipase/Acylhydrolase family